MKKEKKALLTAEEIAVFCEQISLMLGAGIPLYEGMETLEGDFAGTGAQDAFARLCAEVKNSGSLAAGAEASGMFPPYMTGMLRVGEEAGQLDTVVEALALHYAREAQIRRTAMSAVRYPLTLMAVMALVVTVLVFQVMPIFERALFSLSGGAGGASASAMRVGQAAGAAVFAVLVIALTAAGVLALLMRGGRRPQLRRRLLTMTPALARLHKLMTAQKLASVLSMLLRGGFPLEQALDLLPEVYDGEEEKQMMREAGEKMLAGETIGDVIARMGLFEPLHLRMIRVGFASGQADAALAKTADLLAQEIDDATGRLIAMIEPALVVVLSAMIGAILLAVMMPLAGVLGAMA